MNDDHKMSENAVAAVVVLLALGATAWLWAMWLWIGGDDLALGDGGVVATLDDAVLVLMFAGSTLLVLGMMLLGQLRRR